MSTFILIIVPFFIAIPCTLGFVIARSIWVFYRAYGPLQPRLHTRNGLALSIGLISTLLVMSLYAWQIINLDYAMYGSIAIDENGQPYRSQVVPEAWRRSIIPPPFQKSCSNPEEIICQLAEEFRLRLWDSEIYTDDIPWLGGLIAGITSTITVRSLFRSMTRRANSASLDSMP